MRAQPQRPDQRLIHPYLASIPMMSTCWDCQYHLPQPKRHSTKRHAQVDACILRLEEQAVLCLWLGKPLANSRRHPEDGCTRRRGIKAHTSALGFWGLDGGDMGAESHGRAGQPYDPLIKADPKPPPSLYNMNALHL